MTYNKVSMTILGECQIVFAKKFSSNKRILNLHYASVKFKLDIFCKNSYQKGEASFVSQYKDN